MIEAGCKEKEWDDTDGSRYENYKWIGKGKLLAKGVCVDPDYRENFVPEKGNTTVYSTIEYQKVRAVDAKEGTVSIDFTVTMRWLDHNIKTNFSSNDKENGGILLDTNAIAKIWTPDMYILNRTSFKFRHEWTSLQGSTILTTKEFSQIHSTKHPGITFLETTVEIRYEIKSTVYCDFDHSKYPMDTQMCNVSFRSGSLGAVFVLYDPNNNSHGVVTYNSANFDMSVTFFDEQKSWPQQYGNNTVGISIKMSRIVNSFILKYYIPSMAIVLVSELGFVIPVSAIPGRVALLVTQFLTLVNLFIYQMVSQNS